MGVMTARRWGCLHVAIRTLTSLCVCTVCDDRECVFNNYAAFAQNPVFRDQFMMEMTLLEVH